ncbi:MAG: 50S ribosomal protein L23 [Bacteroidia bacterium]|jgi:large subunit ribosomal protein L23
MSILKRPILTEKSVKMTDSIKHPRYTFEVDMNATKPEISAEVEKIYNVKVANVNTMVARGKRHTRNTKKGISRGKSANYKKAIVVLAEGQSINFYENI